MNDHLQDVAAKIALSGSAAGAIIAWLDVIDTMIRISAGLVAIASGVYALMYYRRRFLALGKPDKAGE